MPVETVAISSLYLQHVLCLVFKIADFTFHQLHHVIGVVFVFVLSNLPFPLAFGCLKAQQLFFIKRLQKLNREEGVALGFGIHQVGEGLCVGGFRA